MKTGFDIGGVRIVVTMKQIDMIFDVKHINEGYDDKATYWQVTCSNYISINTPTRAS